MGKRESERKKKVTGYYFSWHLFPHFEYSPFLIILFWIFVCTNFFSLSNQQQKIVKLTSDHPNDKKVYRKRLSPDR